MPVYEFYCADCHTIFNFMSRRVNIHKRPHCPKCGKGDMERQVSFFAYSKGRKDEDSAGGMENYDEAKLEKAMAALAGEMQGVDETDPRQMAKIMRRLSETTGMGLGAHVDEALRRLEDGEDPEKLEEEMGELFEQENPFSAETIKGIRRKHMRPIHDDSIYSLDDGAPEET